MRIVVWGYKGQLGTELMLRSRREAIDAVGADIPHGDITSAASVAGTMADAGDVDAVINACAYTAVDQAESQPELAMAVNSEGAGHLARTCRQMDIPLIHISTDYVFSGLGSRPYRPNDAIGPKGVYAQSKAQGEAAVRRHAGRHVIMRVAWLFGQHGSNFVKTMLRLGRQHAIVRVVDDQVGSPTYAGDLAEALLRVARKIQHDFTAWGTYHYCNQDAVTWHAFARKIFALARNHESLAVGEVIPISTADYPTPAPRPRYSVLDCGRFDEVFNIPRRPWEEALKEMLTDLYDAEGIPDPH